MPYTFEQYQAFYYVEKLLPVLEDSWDFSNTMLRLNGLKKGGLLLPVTRAKKEEDEDSADYDAYREKQLEAILGALKKQKVFYPKLEKNYRQRNIDYLVRVFGLNKQEKCIIDFLSAVDNNAVLERFLDRFHGDISEARPALELVADIPAGASEAVLGQKAPLMQLGILRYARSYSQNGFILSNWAKGFINTKHKDNPARHKALLGPTLADENPLCEDDFAYVNAVDFCYKLFKQAPHTKGFNILLYGIPGTGKTSFAKMLARQEKLELYGIGENSGGSDEKNFRLCQLYRKQYLLAKNSRACVLFDEAEDIFSGFMTKASKVEINRLLEDNLRPVVWTTNHVERMDPAFIRRFTLAVYFDKPPREVREKMWHKYLKQYRVQIDDKEVFVLAKNYEVPPSMIAGAVRSAHLTNGNLTEIKTHLDLMEQALNGGCKRPEKDNTKRDFSPTLIHADMDLNALTGQLKRLGRLNFSLCLYGASGTGKSAYARYLAGELGLEVIHKRASDLMSMFVGGTEHNIARAFAKAKESKALLIFDEADSFLRDRSLAQQSWEISGVNEMLTWMESHPYPFICTTNLMDALDPACLRRFSFKVKYDFLTAQQVCEGFKYFFGLDVSEQDVRCLRTLTPGDFAVVKNKAEILGKMTFEPLLEMLENEQQVKQKHCSKKIGFGL